MPKLAGLWGQLIVFMGSFIAVTNPVYDFAVFLNDNTVVDLALRCRGWLLPWPGGQVLMRERAAVIFARYGVTLLINLAAIRHRK